MFKKQKEQQNVSRISGRSKSQTDASVIEKKIYFLRGQKVMFDFDLAELYAVGTKVLNQAVKRNKGRFPLDFMFQLSKMEFENLKSQFVTSSWGGIRKLPSAFTENGVAMLSSVLHSRRAIQVNIEIMRTFTRLRQIIRSNKVVWKKIRFLEKKYDKQFKVVFDTLRALLEPPERQKKRIGFHSQPGNL